MSSVMSPQQGASQSGLQLLRMLPVDLKEVAHIEKLAYPFPWTEGNFLDSVKSGYDCWILRDSAHNGRMLGYFLAMHAVDETHLLNITVDPDCHGKGHGRFMLDKLCALAREAGMKSVLLEVRPSNARALEIYLRYGFTRIGVRRNYYPAPHFKREDAIVMRLPL
jgi:ribosomal-protein-alanine N-acetyltransferase